MRPRKLILVYSADQDWRADLRYVLDLKGFRAIAAGTVTRAQDVLYDATVVDVALVHRGPTSDLVLKHAAKRGVPTVEARSPKDHAPSAGAGQIANDTNKAEMVECVRRAAMRKRGPKKVTPQQEDTRLRCA